MGSEESRGLLRAYVALEMARRALALSAGAANPGPHLATSAKCQEVALRELEQLLEGVSAGRAGALMAGQAEDECAPLVM